STTSEGVRRRTASIASSLSRAVRTWCPSSSRMPEISSRISVSSSMFRMSDAIVGSCAGGAWFARFFDALWQNKTDDGAGRRPRRIIQLDQPPVVFHDTRDDREARPRPLRARGDIRLDQPVAILFGKAEAVVDDFKLHAVFEI